MSGAVREILDRIRSLSESDRVELEEQLAAWSEAEWQAEASRARQAARASGLDQAAIDRAVFEDRYGGQ